MLWPTDHPAVTDPALAQHAHLVDEVCPEATVHEVLRHVAGRRVTSLVTFREAPAVLKLFAGHRARGNQRRLDALVAAGLGDCVPCPLGAEPSGHAGLVSYRDGTVLDQLDDAGFLVACGRAGVALRRLHDSGAELDRAWTFVEESAQLRRRCPAGLADLVEDVIAGSAPHAGGPLVSAHRDCHPRQLVATPAGAVGWIDLDDCAMAPRGLDVGNLLAHLTREAVVGRRRSSVVGAARDAFLSNYDWPETAAALASWEILSLVRLAGLAETRHGSPLERDALVAQTLDRLSVRR